MKRFVFRAQAALDLRLKQEEEARRSLALAEGRARDARTVLEEANRTLDEMIQRGRADDEAGDVTASIWHRNWLVGQRQRIDRCRKLLTEREAAVVEATGRAQLARRKARALERLRDHAWRRFTREEAREEQKALDELGGVRFVLARQSAGGNT